MTFAPRPIPKAVRARIGIGSPRRDDRSRHNLGLPGQASVIGNRPLLLVAATRDSPDEDVPMYTRMAKTLREAGAKQVTLVTHDDDHPFSSHRIALASVLTHWLRANCTKK